MITMERSEPVFVPEWSRTPTGSFTTVNASSNRSSSNTDDQGNRSSSMRKTSSSGSERDISCNISFNGRSSSSYCRRSPSKGSTQARSYGSFSRSHRDRCHEKDLEYSEREILHLVGNGYCEYPDSFKANGTEKDVSRQSQSTLNGRRPELRPKMPGNEGLLSSRSSVNSISKTSFERDFPSLRTKEKHSPTIQRISSCPIATVQSLPLGSSAMIGNNSWTSALVDVPATTLSDGSGQQPAPTSIPMTASGTNTGLNMAETLAQAPSRSRIPQLSVETQKLEELAIRQSRQLIPVTASTPKPSALNTSEKKYKGVRAGDTTLLSKVVQQPSAQSASYSLRGPARSDASKPSQIGNFQVLNRDRNGVSPNNREVPSPTNIDRVSNQFSSSSSAIGAKLNTDSRAIVASLAKSSMEKKSSSQAQNRHEFFNTIRNSKSSSNSSANQEQDSVMSCPKLNMTAHHIGQAENTATAATSPDSPFKTNNKFCGNYDGSKESESSIRKQLEQVDSFTDRIIDPDEEEVRFLRSLGWEENAGEDALTAEEIDAFKNKYMKIFPIT